MKSLKLTPSALIIALMLTISLSCCRKWSHNGDLDGQWRIISIETLDNGEITNPSNCFYSFFLHTCNLRGAGSATANMTYSKSERKLTLEFPYQENNSSILAPWGIYDWRTTFTVEELNGSRLTLRSDKAVICLRKF